MILDRQNQEPQTYVCFKRGESSILIFGFFNQPRWINLYWFSDL